jgi:hypothetical protein
MYLRCCCALLVAGGNGGQVINGNISNNNNCNIHIINFNLPPAAASDGNNDRVAEAISSLLEAVKLMQRLNVAATVEQAGRPADNSVDDNYVCCEQSA